MKSKERLTNAINHKQPDRIPIDFGATPVSGIHVLVVEKLRAHYGLKKKPVKVIEPYQMLGEIEADLMEALNIDVIGMQPKYNMFGFAQDEWKTFKTNWKQEVLVPKDFNTTLHIDGSIVIYPQGDTTVEPCAKMPPDSYFFDALIRQEPFEEKELNVEDNLEEFAVWSDDDLEHWRNTFNQVKTTDKAIIANFGGTGLGDIALVPAMNLKKPKGIRDIAEWYMSTVMRMDYIHKIFEKQTTIALENLKKAYNIVGNNVDAIYICGTDFGTQTSTFCAPETFDELWKPYYKKINEWIHQNTTWKTFKHCCGSIITLIDNFIDAGFDIINPVQINAAGMEPKALKDQYGDKLVFWGGGIDTQKTLPFGTPEAVKKQVLANCEIFSQHGGFVFTSVHNIQANTPVENVTAMFEALNEFNG
jgi:uroporphyrinogen-III decarboxylase